MLPRPLVLCLVALTLILSCVNCAKTAAEKKESEAKKAEREAKRKAMRADLAGCKADLKTANKKLSAGEGGESGGTSGNKGCELCEKQLAAVKKELTAANAKVAECNTATAQPDACSELHQVDGGGNHFTRISVGPAGVYALDSERGLKYRTGSYGAPVATPEWKQFGDPTFWDPRSIDHSECLTTLRADMCTKWYAQCPIACGLFTQKGNFTHVDVGRDMVVAMWNNDIMYRDDLTPSTPEGRYWETMDTDFNWVTISPAGHIWAIRRNGEPTYRQGSKNPQYLGDSWTDVDGNLVKMSAGKFGVWAVNAWDMVFYREGTMGDVEGPGTAWVKVEGTMKDVSSGDSSVMGINADGEVWALSDMTTKAWTRVGSSANFASVDTWEDQVWGVRTDHPYVAWEGEVGGCE